MGEFNSDDHCIYYRGQEFLRRNGVALIISKSPKCSTWMQCQKQKNDLCLFQGKPFSITVIQVCAPISNAEEAEVEWFYEDLQDLLEQTPKKDVLFIIGDWNANVGSQEIPGVTGKEIQENNRMRKTRDLFKKIRDTKGTFHAKMGTIKDRNVMDPTEAEDIY